jgi:hypothetical protein
MEGPVELAQPKLARIASEGWLGGRDSNSEPSPFPSG